MTFSPDYCHVDSVSPAFNYGDRTDGSIDILLYHYTGMSDSDAALRWLCCEESGVSCHYYIYEDGRIIQLLPESVRAHHAGVGYWRGERDINSRSIGIEIANPGYESDPLEPFPMAQMESVLRLSHDILSRHIIPPERILAHSDIAPTRKSDPGEAFDWSWLSQKGIGHYVSPIPIQQGLTYQEGDSGKEIQEFQTLLNRYGYDCLIDSTFTSQTTFIVRAFQRHFRQSRVDGIMDISTLETLRHLCSSLDV